MEDLATVADLTERNVTVPAGVNADAFLAAAQAAVRDAAGVPISRETFTVTIPGRPEQWLTLPGQPVISVADVLLDAVAVADWKLSAGRLWRFLGWQVTCDEPCDVTATITGGLLDVPKDIVDMVCALAGLGIKQAAGGDYSSRGDMVGFKIDDYSEQFGNYSAGERMASPMEIPKVTRERLRKRFGGGVTVLESK